MEKRIATSTIQIRAMDMRAFYAVSARIQQKVIAIYGALGRSGTTNTRFSTCWPSPISMIVLCSLVIVPG